MIVDQNLKRNFASACSCPYKEQEEVYTYLTRALLLAAKKKIAAAIGGASFAGDLTSLIERHVSGFEGFQPEIGAALKLNHQPGMAIPAAAQLLLALHAGGNFAAEWSCVFDTKAWLMFRGHLFPAERQLEVVSRPGQVSISDPHGMVRFERRAGGMWIPTMMQGSFAGIAPHIADSLGEGLYLTGFHSDRDTRNNFIWPDPALLANPETLSVEKAAAADALKFIRDFGGGYAKWVERSVRCIGLMITPDENKLSNCYMSASYPLIPGYVAFGFPNARDRISAPEASENLVHEASHQYYQLLAAVFPVSTGEDTDLYHSALAKRARPVEKILLAYHAAANMTLFHYEALDRVKEHVQETSLLLERSYEYEQSLRAPLEKTKGLTPVGEMLWRPLAELIDRKRGVA